MKKFILAAMAAPLFVLAACGATEDEGTVINDANVVIAENGTAENEITDQ